MYQFLSQLLIEKTKRTNEYNRTKIQIK